jgi:hypothetical protein
MYRLIACREATSAVRSVAERAEGTVEGTRRIRAVHGESAIPPKAEMLPHDSEWSNWARFGLMHRSKAERDCSCDPSSEMFLELAPNPHAE